MPFMAHLCNLQRKMFRACELTVPVDGLPQLSLRKCGSVVRSAVNLGTMLLAPSKGEALLRPGSSVAGIGRPWTDTGFYFKENGR